MFLSSHVFVGKQADSVAKLRTVITHCEKKQYKKTSKCIALEVCVCSRRSCRCPRI